MSQPAADTATSGRITPGPEAERLARAAYDALLGDLARLTDDDWQRPTECEGWTVRDMVAHLVGAAEGHASLPVYLRQYVWGLRHRSSFGGSSLDAMNQRQIDEQGPSSGTELVGRLRVLAPRAVAGRVRMARVLGWFPVRLEQAGSWYAGMPTRTNLAELAAVVLTRDVWAHRLDVCRALGLTPSLDPEVDGRIVAGVVADWASRHGRPVTLTLTGAAGGEFRVGTGGPTLTLDALDFARVLAGRRPEGEVPESPLWEAKVLF